MFFRGLRCSKTFYKYYLSFVPKIALQTGFPLMPCNALYDRHAHIDNYMYTIVILVHHESARGCVSKAYMIIINKLRVHMCISSCIVLVHVYVKRAIDYLIIIYRRADTRAFQVVSC
jgi:hypothetical protein